MLANHQRTMTTMIQEAAAAEAEAEAEAEEALQLTRVKFRLMAMMFRPIAEVLAQQQPSLLVVKMMIFWERPAATR